MTLSNLTSSSLYKARGGLLGAGNWASVTATTGTPTTGTYTDANGVAWKYYWWTASGSVTFTDGLIDSFLISGGLAGITSFWSSGGGIIVDGVRSVTAGTHTITVGAGGTSPDTGTPTLGQPSSIGTLYTTGYSGNIRVGSRNGNSGSSNVGFTTTITGSSLDFGKSGDDSPRANRGDGRLSAGSGSSGSVIIRVPSAFALV